MFTSKIRLVRGLALLAALSIASQTPAFAASKWVEQGPGPTLGGQGQGLPDNPVSGAINAIAPDPSNADVVYVGTVNGGIWKTTNATAASPTWIPLTDKLPGSSIKSLAISPVNSQLLFAGTGSTSSAGQDGSPGFGVLRSTNGGKSWTVLAKSTFAGQVIHNIVPTALDNGKVVLAATGRIPGGTGSAPDGGGVYRSTNKGSSFTRLSGNGTSGLPDQGVTSLIADPGNSSRFYAAVPSPEAGATGNEGVYRSDDGGVTWTLVSTGLTNLNTSLRILLSVHNNSGLSTNAVYAMIIGPSPSGHFQGVFRSGDHGGTWTQMIDPPINVFPGGQGTIHAAIVADQTNPNVVFISGDRQDTLPGPYNCTDFVANNLRGDADLGTWESVVCDGANGTAPHSDARDMIFDANGDILHSSDGGIYKLAHPNSAGLRQWSSIMGDIRPSEMQSVVYDPVSNIVFAGTQDNGTTVQSTPGDFTWNQLIGGDGENVAVDSDQTAHSGTSIRYSSFQNFGFFNRTTWDATNTLIDGPTEVGLNITSGPGTGMTLRDFDPNIQFAQPFVLNAIDPSRMLIGTGDIYESMDKGDSLTNLEGNTGSFVRALAYGGRLNGADQPDVFYVGAGPNILHRVNVGGSITTLTAYPGSGVISLVMDPQNYQHVYVVDDQSRVWASFDEGGTWKNLTANLPKLSSSIRVVEIFNPIAAGDDTVLIAGGLGGVFQLKRPATAKSPKWSKLSSKLPPGCVVRDLHYDYTDNVLVAATLGRGAWTLTGFFPGTASAAFEAEKKQPSRAKVGGFNLNVPKMPSVYLPAQ